MSFFGEKPSSRVLRPPGGGSSNIFGGSDDGSSGNKGANTKPTFQSSVFSNDPEPEKPKSTRPDRMSSNIFGTDSNDNKISTTPKTVSKTHQSSLFQNSEPVTVEDKKAAPRQNTITGATIGEAESGPATTPAKVENGSKENESPRVSKEPVSETKPVKDNTPHLGPVKNTSGVRCAQPPGGKSSISFS